jgi:hypothetical protein
MLGVEFVSALPLRSLRLGGSKMFAPSLHRRDAENAEEAQRVPSKTLRRI